MPFRTKNTYTTPDGGVVNTKKHTYTGRGRAPAGTRKTRAPKLSEVPTVTRETGPTGTVTRTSGFASPTAARVAATRSRKASRRVKRIVASEHRAQAASLAMGRRQRGKRMTTSTVVSSRPGRPPLSGRPREFQGKPTAGTPTRAELRRAASKETLGINKAGAVTTPKVRKASQRLQLAAAIVAKTQPSLAGLSPAERAVVPLARKAHRKYPDIPISVIMAQVKQESGFNAAAVSSAGAQGLSQFIPSTAASYGVRYGTGKREQQSQITGQAHLLHDDSFSTDPQGALSAYSGGYAAGDYNNPILVDAKASYAGLDKPGNPKALRRLSRARKGAEAVGLKPKGGPAGAKAKQQEYLKVFGKQVTKQLKLVKAGKYTTGPGKLVVGDSDISKGHEPEIAARLKILSAKKGVPIYIISGDRTPQHSVEVGGFADDPHTKGEAADIGVGSALRDSAGSLTEADYESVGLHRPYYPESSAEINHVELLNGGTPATGGGGGGSVSTGTVSGGVSSGEVSAFAQATGRSPKQVRRALRNKKLTPQQILRKLASVGAGVGEGKKAKEPETHPVLKEMIEKYGSGQASGVPTEAAERKARLSAAQAAAKP